MKQSGALVLTAVVLALASCGGGSDRGKSERGGSGDVGSTAPRGGSGAPFGFEMAAAAASEVPAAPVAELSPEEVSRALATGSIRLIDIRTDAEVADGGTIPGAEHIPMDQLDASVLENNDGREVVLYCRSGKRSEMAATKLVHGFGVDLGILCLYFLLITLKSLPRRTNNRHITIEK